MNHALPRFVDLHTHSTASDGRVSPSNLIDAAAKAGLVAVALTDHDTTTGLAEAADRAKAYPELEFVPGIEVSAHWEGETMHLLGLNIDSAAVSMISLCKKLMSSRNDRNPKMIAKMQAEGLPISMESVRACLPDPTCPNVPVSRLHMAMALQRAGAVRDTQEAMDKYIGQYGSAFIDKERLSPRVVIEAIHGAGGLAIVAHPTLLNMPNRAAARRVFQLLKDAGLDGVECYHSQHSDTETRMYVDLARELDLRITGGSDFHGSGKPHISLGHPRVPASVWEN